jgi:dTDP-4-dehydrorhamnose reductase
VTRRVLLTGGSGQVGRALLALDWPEDVAIVAPNRAALDLADPDGVARYVRNADLAAILSVGAYTAVDRAESEVGAAWAANALAPALLAARAGAAGIPIVQVSTDYVFDGSGERPWREDDPVRPLGVYGASKEGGEQGVRTAARRHVILRTSWVVSATGQNFVRTMLRLGAERDELRIVADQIGAPTHAGDLAQAIRTVLLRLLADDPDAPTGTFHVCNAGETSWHGFAERIFAEAARRGRRTPRLVPIPTADYPTPARRPLNSRLDTGKLARDFAIRLRPWQEASDEIVAALVGQADG